MVIAFTRDNGPGEAFTILFSTRNIRIKIQETAQAVLRHLVRAQIEITSQTD